MLTCRKVWGIATHFVVMQHSILEHTAKCIYMYECIIIIYIGRCTYLAELNSSTQKTTTTQCFICTRKYIWL